MQKKTLAVLLTVHNRRLHTLVCMDALFAQDWPKDILWDVFMVDDGSTDGTAQSVKERFPGIYVIQADGSLYWNRGMHRAWDAAVHTKSYDYYLWLNDDTILLPRAICALFLLSEVHNNMAIVVGATKSSLSDVLTYGGRINNHIALCDGMPHEVNHFNGNIVLVPKAVYMMLGNLDYYYHHSKGDIDYGIRAQKAGVKMFQCGNVLGICDAHATIDGWCNPALKFRERWRLMHMPNGMPPKEIFHLEKQSNVLLACFHYITTYLHCMFPRIWVILGKCK